jgi:hypothetical protein
MICKITRFAATAVTAIAVGSLGLTGVASASTHTVTGTRIASQVRTPNRPDCEAYGWYWGYNEYGVWGYWLGWYHYWC